jgi:hypothetical protein
MNQGKVNIAIVGLGFGAEFIPIYQNIRMPTCTPSASAPNPSWTPSATLSEIEKRYTDFNDLLKDPNVDAVHINSPIPDHAWQSIAALKAGKHVACTVPMATSIEDCKKIVDLVKKTGLTYMMMETVVYAREFLYMKELYDKGTLGKLQFIQASHQQDMDGWPNYWPGLPPMWYATHCVGPVCAMANLTAEYVSCFGSGTIRPELVKHYNSPFAVESAHINSKIQTFPRASFARCSIPRANIAKASTFTAPKPPSNGRWSSMNRSSCTPPKNRSRKFPSRQSARLRKTPAQGNPRFTTKGVYDLGKKRISALCKAPATAVPIRIWPTNS